MNKYSTTRKTISMTMDDADTMIAELWDRAYDKTKERREKVAEKSQDELGVRMLCAYTLNAFEDLLREEWGMLDEGE